MAKESEFTPSSYDTLYKNLSVLVESITKLYRMILTDLALLGIHELSHICNIIGGGGGFIQLFTVFDHFDRYFIFGGIA
jgi:hypothetical protein